MIKPLYDNILVKVDADDGKSDGGIILTSPKRIPQYGEVHAIGDGSPMANGERRPAEVEIGDRVLFQAGAGQKVTLDGTEFLMIQVDHIIAVMES